MSPPDGSAPLRASLFDSLVERVGLEEAVARGRAAQEAVDRLTNVEPEPPLQREQEESMGKEMPKEERSPRDYTTVERRAVLEKTRGLGMQALAKVCREIGVSRTTIYVWRKELWGTGNAYGIADKKAAPRPRPDDEADEPETEVEPGVRVVGTDGRKYRTDEEKRRLVTEAYADKRGVGAFCKDHGIAEDQIRRWAAKYDIEAPEIERVRTDGKVLRTTADKLRLLAEAEAYPDGIKAYSKVCGVAPISLLTWRRQRDAGKLGAPADKGGGPARGKETWRAEAAKRLAAKAPRPVKGKPKPNQLTAAEKLAHVTAAERSGDLTAYGRRMNISHVALGQWRRLRDEGKLGAPARSREVVTVDKSDVEVLENYERERALKRTTKPGPDPRDEKIKRLEIEVLTLKVNLRAAMLQGYLSFLDVDKMFETNKKG